MKVKAAATFILPVQGSYIFHGSCMGGEITVFIGMPDLSLRILLFMSSTVYFLGTQPVGFLFVFNHWCKKEEQQGDSSCVFAILAALVYSGLF